MKKEFSLELQARVKECENSIKEYLPREEGMKKSIATAMNYAVEAGGKRLRPLLMKSAYELFRKDSLCDRLLPAFMASMEMIHTFSLCHDDLPCMDNDRYRRGKESTWYHFGEAMGTLAGDALSLYAFQLPASEFRLLMSDRGEGSGEELAKRFSGALFRLSECSGIDGMLGGQVIDVEKTGQELTAEELDYIYRLKTGALIRGSLEIAAMLAGAGEQELALAGELGEKLGLAFQIQDDVLDVCSTEEELGKPVHSDEENKKSTYVSIYGIEAARREVERLSFEALLSLHRLSEAGEHRDFMEELIRYLIHRKS